MSSVDVSSTLFGSPALVAGNTADSLSAVNAVEQLQSVVPTGLPSAADLDHIAEELHAFAATQKVQEVSITAGTGIAAGTGVTAPVENDFVSRAELDVVASALGELEARIAAFNARSGQKI